MRARPDRPPLDAPPPPRPPRHLAPVLTRPGFPFHHRLIAIFAEQARANPELIAATAVPSARPVTLLLLVDEELRRCRRCALRAGRAERAAVLALWLRLLADFQDDALALAARTLAARRRPHRAAGRAA